MQHKHKNQKYFFNNIFLIISSLTISLLAAEMVLRIFDFATINIDWYYAENIQKVVWDDSEVPNVGSSELDGLKLEGTSNSLGLRDEEYPLLTKNFRILAIGDSFTYGFKLANASSWPKLAEQYLREDGWKDVEILNAGRPNTDTQSQYNFFKKYTSKYKPDMVVINYIINDCSKVCSNCGVVDLKGELGNIVKGSKKWYSSKLLTMIRLIYHKYILTKVTMHNYFKSYEHENSENFLGCKNAFLGFKKMSEEMNFKLIVVIYPLLYKLDENYPFIPIHNKMLEFFKVAGIPAYDLTPVFYGHKDTDLWVQVVDSHPNRKANTIAALRIAEIIKSHSPSKREGQPSNREIVIHD